MPPTALVSATPNLKAHLKIRCVSGARYEMRYRSLTFYTSSYELKLAAGGATDANADGFAKVQVPDGELPLGLQTGDSADKKPSG
eukprot:1344160-Prymnesium_polylepis.1